MGRSFIFNIDSSPANSDVKLLTVNAPVELRLRHRKIKMLLQTSVRLVLTIITLALAFPTSLIARTDKISIIRARYARINRDIQRCKKVEHDVSERFRSLEGDELVAYLCSGARRKIVLTHYWETSRVVEDYYYWEGRLFFIRSRHLRYDGTFGDVVRIEENRYYFAADQLIRWIGKDGRVVKAGGEEGRKQERELLGKAKELLEVANSGKGNSNGGTRSNKGKRPTCNHVASHLRGQQRTADAGRLGGCASSSSGPNKACR